VLFLEKIIYMDMQGKAEEDIIKALFGRAFLKLAYKLSKLI